MPREPLRIVSWNVENFARHRETLPAIASRLGEPDVLCLQELRVRPQDADLVAEMANALPGYVCHWSLNRDARNVTFRGGRMYGVATWVRAALKPVQRTFEWDREGRVVVSELPREKLAIVNVYAVNGTSKAYFDHELGRLEGDRHQFKRRFIERLGEEARALQARDLSLVLIGDWNVSRTKLDTHPRLRTEEPHALARKLFNERFLPDLGVVDAFRALHPEARKYTWFNARARSLDAARVDFALVSESLMPRVLEADIDESKEARVGSDHAPLWLTLAR
jgi:exodeoxyribonuclease III